MPPQSIASSGPAHYPAWATVPGLRGHFIALRIYNAASQMQFLTESATAVQARSGTRSPRAWREGQVLAVSEFAKAITVDAERPEITGQLRRRDRRPAPWDHDVSIPVWTLKGPNGGERSIHGVPAVPRRLMEQHEDDVMLGEDVTVRYVGNGQTSTGRDFVIHELEFPEREAV